MKNVWIVFFTSEDDESTSVVQVFSAYASAKVALDDCEYHKRTPGKYTLRQYDVK